MQKLYKPHEVQRRIREIKVDENEKKENISYKEVLFSKKYARATFTGNMLSFFQQMTGINFIMFYSNTLFADVGMPSSQVTGLVGVVNFVSTFGGLALVSKFGRRPILVYGAFAISVVLILQGVFSLSNLNYLSITCTMLFIAFFEFSPGPLLFIYASEIMTDLGVSLALMINFLISLIVSIITPYLVKAIGEENIGWIFVVMGVVTFFSVIFEYKYVLETKGKTKQEIEFMFSDEPDKHLTMPQD